MAYEPRDVLWDNLDIRGRSRVIREFIVWIITLVIAILWFVPVTAVSALIEIDTIEKINPAVAERIRESTIGTLIFSSLLPTIILNIFTSLLPLLFDGRFLCILLFILCCANQKHI
jgi:hypothetical protein